MRQETAVVAKNMDGSKEYQVRARATLPILVRQAISGKPIFYQQLADELGMPNPRNLNYVLGSVGQSLIELGRRWNETIPPIQCLVINQTDKMPGEGFGWFMPNKSDWKELSKRQRAVKVEAVMQQIYAYPRWGEVLQVFSLSPLSLEFDKQLEGASNFRAGGESQAHLRLKKYIKDNPQLIGLLKRDGPGVTEKPLPSGDRVDVYFEAETQWVGVEVKSAISDEYDLTRGLFQCVKYAAVINAMVVAEQKDILARSVLVLECALPNHLVPLKHMFGVEVIENVRVD